MNRRIFLAMLTAVALGGPASHVRAKDGGGDDGGRDDSGGDDSDDSGHDDDGGRGKKREDDAWSQDRALRERERGRVISLQAVLRIVGGEVRGRVIDIDLGIYGGRPQYRVKVRRADGVIKTVRLDARTGRVIRFLGF